MYCAFVKGIQDLKRHKLLKTISASDLLSHTAIPQLSVGVLQLKCVQVRPR